MRVRRGVECTTTAIAALCLPLALCLAGCASPGGGPPASSPSASQGYVPATQAPVAGPVPTPRPAPPPSLNGPPVAPLATSGPATGTPRPSATQSQNPGTAKTPNPAASPPSASPTVSGSPSPQAPAPFPAAVDSTGTAVYFVAIGDGGSRGVRFGCDDSLVAVRFSAPAGGDPLAAAMGQLLAPDDTATRAGLYNALSGSALRYVSGYLDGSTAVVNLSGSLRPGGVCDHPRIETQLTQTAVAATGASQAAIYIDGRPLSEVLRLR
ncbi:GerMN domain-containing protein [Arthrobacter sp. MMS18-M83]|uniref:GerMN domain-containing protein n=1 Tax=Arthrobacter sp. MMS18-M83 TaxID=2996261 RepID=UPI00227C86B3|nr:GerMN domain-containing protein [Arthrobacter sp. MMS18-M83]WAH95337.1 GerMN domain-containing protein [Arthrobacter sp. MMS18-M83]